MNRESKKTKKKIAQRVWVCPICAHHLNIDHLYSKPIEDLQLSVKAHNELLRRGIDTLGGLLTNSESDIYDYWRVGRRVLREYQAALAPYGLSLGGKII